MSEFNIGDKVYLECKVIRKDMSDNTYQLKYRNWHSGDSNTNFVEGDVLHTPDEVYNKGLNDAWELAKKIVISEEDGGYSLEELRNIFGYGDFESILKVFTLQEAHAKVKAYEERNEIQKGDVVRLKGLSCKAIVTRVTKTNMCLLFKDGGCSLGCYKEDFKKTGEHFDSIDEFMRSEE
jgi:hypothetical protein